MTTASKTLLLYRTLPYLSQDKCAVDVPSVVDRNVPSSYVERENAIFPKMEPEKSVSGKVAERPITRWRRDQQEEIASTSKGIDRPPTGIVRPQSKYDRPRSRRGHKDESSEYSGSTVSFRSATPGRFALARPPSASFLSNRVPTAGSRLVRMDSGLPRSNTGMSATKQFNVNVLDRPITQHGIAGVRPGTTRGLPMTR